MMRKMCHFAVSHLYVVPAVPNQEMPDQGGGQPLPSAASAYPASLGKIFNTLSRSMARISSAVRLHFCNPAVIFLASPHG